MCWHLREGIRARNHISCFFFSLSFLGGRKKNRKDRNIAVQKLTRLERNVGTAWHMIIKNNKYNFLGITVLSLFIICLFLFEGEQKYTIMVRKKIMHTVLFHRNLYRKKGKKAHPFFYKKITLFKLLICYSLQIKVCNRKEP